MMSEAEKQAPEQPYEAELLPNIYQRINAVREKVGYIKKDKEVKGQGYKGATHDFVTANVRPYLIEQGIVIVPRQRSSGHEVVGQTQKGAPIIRYEAEYEIDFVNADSPEDRVTVHIWAHANDHGDKAPGKACSYAVKYAMLKLFSIETGEDDESRIDFEGLKPITDEQAAELLDLIEQAEADKTKYLEYLRQTGKVRITSIEEIPAKMYDDAKAALVSKVEAKRKQAEAQA